MKYLLGLVLLLGFMQPSPSVVNLTSPSPFQVFQRDTATNTGALVITGHVDNTNTSHILNASWRGLNLDILFSDMNGDFVLIWSDLPVGQGELSLFIDDALITVPNVAIGDIYIIAGQSNAVGQGTNDQMYMDSTSLRAGMFTAAGWKELQDPVGAPQKHNVVGGSLWPLLASYILALNIPVAFVPTAVNGSSIQQWQPDSDLYTCLIDRVDQLPTPYARAVLWEQGETVGDTPVKTYSVGLSRLAMAIDERYHIPLLAAYLYNNPTVNSAIDLSIGGDTNVFSGADLRDWPLTGYHYYSDDALLGEAWRWWEALIKLGFYQE